MPVKLMSYQMEICGLTTRYSVKNTGYVARPEAGEATGGYLARSQNSRLIKL
jgi:hypothetical protein